jgi:hypothetical protein
VSYDLGPSGPQSGAGSSASFDFSAGGKTVTKKLDLEEMYGYFVVQLKPSDPLLELLQGKGDVTGKFRKVRPEQLPADGIEQGYPQGSGQLQGRISRVEGESPRDGVTVTSRSWPAAKKSIVRWSPHDAAAAALATQT